ncbi:MAG TPA: L,D-transpeptidase family protein, partial [Solirubrobacteraceae bacterium]|nr:L,D-transpeptidase family protein [Solirubrobacteraceae bacterium]
FAGHQLGWTRAFVLSVVTVAVLSGCGTGASTSAAVKTKTSGTQPTTTTAQVKPPPVAGAAPSARPRVAQSAAPLLQLGSHGAAVRALQSELARLTCLPSSAVDGVFGMRTWHSVVAFQGWSGLVRDGVVGSQTRAALAHARVPRPWSTATGFEVHIAQQVLLIVAGGRVQRAIHVSTGRPGWPTPVGHFTIQSRSLMSWSVPFQVWMPLAQYFDDGYAMHEFSDVPAYPASHGCIRVASEEAQTVWQFGRIGMRLWTSP